MSPSAMGSVPHTRAFSVNGGMPNGYPNGPRPNKVDNLRTDTRVYPPLAELLQARPSIDERASIGRLIEEAERSAKAAETNLDFRRPDIALQEFIKASMIVVNMIPRHRDFPDLQAKSAHERYRSWMSLQKRISTQHDQFAEVKKVIKENNDRNGVIPATTVGSGTPSTVNGSTANGNSHNRTISLQNPTPNGTGTGTMRMKPPIQPKPNSLHGNTLPNAIGNGFTTTPADLASRFARLRSPVQDPRIKTHPIPISQDSSRSSSPASGNYTTAPHLNGPREMPSVPKTLPRSPRQSMGIEIPNMPKPPDPVYSPDRGTDNSATANLLTSNSRSSSFLGRTNMAPPISTVKPTPTIVEAESEYFAPTHKISTDRASKSRKSHEESSSRPGTVTAEELVKLLEAGSREMRLLLVDIRSREEFDSGHIMASSIICVEPITLRNGISGDQLGDCMILAPEFEQDLYEQRDEFDLVVFHDQSSTSIYSSALPGVDSKLHDFYYAVYEYGYDKQTKRKPLLLYGGLDAWIDLLGPSSLYRIASDGSSETSAKVPLPLSNPRIRDARGASVRRRKVRSSRPLSEGVEKEWEAKLREEHVGTIPAVPEESQSEAQSQELVYARTTEDFLRKYPEIPSVQESMITPRRLLPEVQPYHDTLANVMPMPPARPAPALPRQMSRGISERGTIAAYAHRSNSITPAVTKAGLTGLKNPGVLCYMNSAIQALSSTKFFRDGLMGSDTRHPVPKKKEELSPPPQLMVRCLRNVLLNLWNGQYDFINPRTMADYCSTVAAGQMHNERARAFAYGGSKRQHDCSEFLLWLLTILDDELNPARNNPIPKLTDDEQTANSRLSRLTALKKVVELAQTAQQSMIAKNLYLLRFTETTCSKCSSRSPVIRPEFDNILTLSIKKSGQDSLQDALSREFGSRAAERVEYTCERCKIESSDCLRLTYMGYLSEYLIISLSRYAYDGHVLKKLHTTVTFGKTIDLTPYFAPAEPGRDPQDLPPQMRGPFQYEVYAVVHHRGENTLHGHYWTVAKHSDNNFGSNASSTGDWYRFNDETIAKVTWEEAQGPTAAMLFLKRC